MQLQTPNGGGFSNIWNRSCNTAQFGNLDITFKDGEAAIMCANPTTGLYAPASPMTGFTGNNPSGTWNLVFVDFYNGDTGVVNEWSVELCTTTTTVTLSNQEFELNEFALYPNPSDGTFNLMFNSTSGKDINISIYDMSGRLVYDKNYNKTARFNENISLQNVSSGMYLLNVTDNDKTLTKKLIIE